MRNRTNGSTKGCEITNRTRPKRDDGNHHVGGALWHRMSAPETCIILGRSSARIAHSRLPIFRSRLADLTRNASIEVISRFQRVDFAGLFLSRLLEAGVDVHFAVAHNRRVDGPVQAHSLAPGSSL